MKCPKCAKGDIRVIDTIAGGHSHPFFCDECFTFFKISYKHGVSYHFPTLPPEHPVEVDLDMTAHMAHLDKEMLKKLPLLEEVKKKLGKK